MNWYEYKLSLIAHGIGGILILVSIILTIKNYASSYKENNRLSDLIIMLLLFSIAITLHGISHFQYENTFQYENRKTFDL